jgi:hypothetical protein
MIDHCPFCSNPIGFKAFSSHEMQNLSGSWVCEIPKVGVHFLWHHSPGFWQMKYFGDQEVRIVEINSRMRGVHFYMDDGNSWNIPIHPNSMDEFVDIVNSIQQGVMFL